MRWLQKKAIEKSKAKKKSLRVKLYSLLEEKQLLSELILEKEKNKATNQPGVLNSVKKFIYNNSSKKLTTNQEKLLELGLNFAVTPKKFPVLEYIAAAEDLCQSLEER